jgi:hypothetical protein
MNNQYSQKPLPLILTKVGIQWTLPGFLPSQE